MLPGWGIQGPTEILAIFSLQMVMKLKEPCGVMRCDYLLYIYSSKLTQKLNRIVAWSIGTHILSY